MAGAEERNGVRSGPDEGPSAAEHRQALTALPADRLAGPTVAVLTRAAAAVVALPTLAAWVAGQTASGLVHRAAARLPDPPQPSVPSTSGPAHDTAEAVARILAVPSSPTPRRAVALARTGLPDLPLALASTVPALAAFGWRYPRAFRPRGVPGADGASMAALVALQPRRAAPAVIVAHGATTTKAFDYVRRACLRAYAAGFHVLAPDLRGYGVTALIAEAPTSLGTEEGRDLLAAAAWLRDRGATSVGAVGFSLGGAAVLGAARRDPSDGGLDGGALALSAPTDWWATLEHVSTRPRLRDPALLNWLALRADATSRARAAGWSYRAVSPLELVERVAAPWYGLSARELARRASAVLWAGEIRAPTLLLHAVDDLVVPVDQARAFAREAAGNDQVQVLVRPTGRHTLFDVLDPVWLRDVERAWFDAWARR